MDNLCIYKECKNISEYNYEDENTLLYCSKHKMENMINIKCKTIYCNTLINKEYNEYCSLCFIHSFYVF